jgi:5,10-methylene-tetrahydrofolate dehydrogenase/methenyl tetrahydrofolate cyclohydrolase
MMWIISKVLRQDELVEPEVTVMDMGMEGVKDVFPGWEKLVCEMIDKVRTLNSSYNDEPQGVDTIAMLLEERMVTEQGHRLRVMKV